MYVTSCNDFDHVKRKTMKKLFISSIITASLLTGCSSVYQSGQTPDDIYFSPGKEVGVVEVKRNNNDEDRYQEYTSTSDNRYLRMRVANRNRWSNIDDFSYWNDMRYNFSPLAFNTMNNFNNWGWGSHPWGMQLNPWNIGCNNGLGISAWSNWYGGGWGNGLGGSHLGWGSPIFNVITYANPKAIPATYTSGSNINAYRNRTYNNANIISGGKDSWYAPGNSASNNGLGNLVKRVFTQPNTSGNNNNSYDRPARTFGSSSGSNSAPSSNAGGSSGGFKSSGSSASTPRGRGN
ncbi:MAG: hypothetical protein EAZ41_00020 [Sphingobacteriia bacterium]|nr:MAG: hypothetical protein EAZ41_00020 [Sphingobacteriia bacterium]